MVNSSVEQKQEMRRETYGLGTADRRALSRRIVWLTKPGVRHARILLIY
jgi:hypothetical protein